MNNNAPIGIFDSGVGGSSIWKEIHKLLPSESTIYLADSKNAPYGNRTQDEIIGFSIKNTECLLSENVKLIVVACNTATTNAIATLRSNYSIPFIGIEPAIKPAALNTQTGSIGILATKGTLSSALFHETSKEFTKDISVIEIVGEGLVHLVESGRINSPETIALLKKYTQPMLEANIDHLVLGCSHYPYLIPILEDLLPDFVTIIDSGAAVARQTQSVLANKSLLADAGQHPDLQFYTNTEVGHLRSLLSNYIPPVKVDTLDF